MFWGDRIVDEFLATYGEKAGERPLVIRDEKTLSGRPHVGSLRSFMMHAVISDILTERAVPHAYFYEINDTDAFDAVPPYVPPEWEVHLGKRLKDVPSPDGEAENYALYFAKEYTEVLIDAGYTMEFYYNSHRYEAGEYDKYLRLALDNKDQIRAIYKEVSGSIKDENWYPCQIVCDKCGKISTTRVTGWDGEEVEYICDNPVRYTSGCGHNGRKSPFSGNATMPWKVEWAAKFAVVDVDLEGAGKDHYAAGGSRHVSNRICEEIFGHTHPFDVRHEFILLKEGAKMSSSAGTGATAVELYRMLPRYLFRFMMTQKDVMKTISFDPEGDTIPVLFDQYDEVCRDYFQGVHDEVIAHKNRIFEMTHFNEPDLAPLRRFLPRFTQVAFFLQLPHIDIEKTFEEIKGAPLDALDLEELTLRMEYARNWLSTYSPPHYVFQIKEDLPAETSGLSAVQREFLHALSGYLAAHHEASGEEIQGFIHDQKRVLGVEPKEVFEAIYLSLLGRDSGPKAGWLIESLDRDFLITRFAEV